MSLFSLIAVLLIEQIWPLPYRWIVFEPLSGLARFLEGRFNAGEHSHGLVAWLIAVGGLILVASGMYLGLHAINPLLGGLWTILVLYLTMGFRQFSHYFSDIQLALRMDDLPHARKLLSEWRGRPAGQQSPSEIARLAIEEAFRASHRHVFGVLVCFVLLPGPCGAVLYRAAAFFADTWGKRVNDVVGEFGDFGIFARQAFAVIDWLPLRLTAAGFAAVGNFEDAMYCWRKHAGNGIEIVLASGAGALGVRLGRPAIDTADRSEIGAEADVDSMQSAVGLIWRALVLWLIVLLLLGFAGLFGL